MQSYVCGIQIYDIIIILYYYSSSRIANYPQLKTKLNYLKLLSQTNLLTSFYPVTWYFIMNLIMGGNTIANNAAYLNINSSGH